jgi:hypothetical protein
MTQAFQGLRIGLPKYSDSQLYRLLAAHTISTGGASCKSDFDRQISKIGDIEEANRIIELTDKRPGCRANVDNFRFECRCGNAWNFDQEPPACKESK